MKHIFLLLKKHFKYTIIIAILTLIYVGLTLFIPLFFGKMIDALNDNVDFIVIYYYINLSIIFILLATIFNYLILVLNTRLLSKIVYDLKEKAFNKLFNLDMNYFDTNQSGAIINKTILNIDGFSDGFTALLNDLLRNILTVIGVLIFMVIICYPIAIIVFLLTPLSILFTKFMSKYSYKYAKDLIEKRERQTKLINEVVFNQKNIINNNYQDNVILKFEKTNSEFANASFKQTFISSIVNPTSRFIFSTIYAIVILLASIFIIKDVFPLFKIGALSSLLAYVTQYTRPFNEITNILTEVQNSIACYDSLQDFMNLAEETDNNNQLDFSNTERNIEFKNVYFSYDKTKKLIEDCNILANTGNKIAIVGQTGAGKSTLINLLLRFYDIDAGTITINNQNIFDYNKKSLRKQFGLVLQDTWIKTGSIYDNLTMGTNYSKEEIDTVLKQTMLYDFVYSLPDGLDTIISSHKNLSLGQRQLICIARVMLKNPNILLLDEATSNIDLLSEININKSFDKLMEGKTTFVVAHRFKTIKNANLIIVLKDGKIIEIGNHSTLLKQKGYYYELFSKQLN